MSLELEQAAAQLAELGHPTRLGIFRILVRAGHQGVAVGEITVWSTPRRLALIAKGLPQATAAVSEELKGPRSSAPPQALEGFLRKTGLTQDQLEDRDGVYFAVIDKPGRATAEVLAEADELMTELGWRVRPSPDGLDAVVTTGWFGFEDDVALRVFTGPKETRVDMRSASRQGRSDLGVNRGRILNFLNRLNERLGGAYKPKMQRLDEEQHAH